MVTNTANGTLEISIHAPAKGATLQIFNDKKKRIDFNPRSREGSDQCTERLLYPLYNFNPRSREGSDPSFCGSPLHQLFQSTLPRRERHFNRVPKCCWCHISIHAPAKGATDLMIIGTTAMRHFNPRSREGSDSNIIQQISFSLYNTVYFVSNNIK